MPHKFRIRLVLGLALLGPVAVTHAAPDGRRPEATASSASVFPQPRDENGRFLNLAGEIERAGPGVTLPFFLRRIGKIWSGREAWTAPLFNDGSGLIKPPAEGTLRATWIGHATFLLQVPAGNVLTDPIWSERASPFSFVGPERLHAPGVALDSLPRIDAVVVSHNPYDHLEQPSLGEIARRNPEAIFVVGLGNAPLLVDAGVAPGRIRELGWGHATMHHGLTITVLPTQHWSQRWTGDHNEDLWASFSIADGEERIYFGGDSGYFKGYRAIGEHFGPFELAALPIGAYAPAEMMRPFHMNPEEAVQTARELRARRVVGMHFATFDLSDEAPAEPPRRLAEAARAAGYSEADAFVLQIGETRLLGGEPAVADADAGRKQSRR